MCCPPLRSNVNLARIVRTAGCCGVRRVIACGRAKIDPRVARDGAETVEVERRRSLGPALETLRAGGLQLVGVEQATHSESLFDFTFERRTALVLGHERTGIPPEILRMLDRVVEIPVYGLPYSYNVATAATMVLYEYCRQFPDG